MNTALAPSLEERVGRLERDLARLLAQGRGQCRGCGTPYQSAAEFLGHVKWCDDRLRKAPGRKESES